jgi:hypothetical protein
LTNKDKAQAHGSKRININQIHRTAKERYRKIGKIVMAIERSDEENGASIKFTSTALRFNTLCAVV